MKKIIVSLFAVIILLPMFFICSYKIYAQNESGTRYLNDTAFKEAGFWYDSTNSMFQNNYPIIRSIPPLSTGMPFDIMYSYIYLDSLLRFTSNLQQDSLMGAFTSINDTLANSAKFLYKMVDYNPIIFNQYMGEVALNNISIGAGGKYQSTLYNLKNNLANKLKSFVSAANRNAIFSLLFADYILKIHVIAIDSTADKRILSGIESSNSKRYKVYAIVQDTIKGKVFIDENPELPTYISKKKEIVFSTEEPVISFQYVKMTYSQHQYYTNDTYSNIENDSAFIDYTGGFKMAVGQDAVVFLRHTNQLFDFQKDYFDLDLESLCSNNALPIINGNVRDLNLIWSQNTLQSYQNWRQSINGLIQKILTNAY